MTAERGEPAFEDPRRVLARHGLSPKRSFSQNFLTSKGAVDRIAAAVDPRPDELVVELGPGVGTLTAALLRAGARVRAIEADPTMRQVLAAELGSDRRLQVVEGDARTVDFDAIARDAGNPVAVAGNLPYAITGSILRHLVSQRRAISRAVIMVQREVRDRLLAEPGTKQYGALTVFVSAAFRARPVMLVRPGSFHPPPKVSSAVVLLVPHDEPPIEEDAAFRTVVRALFDARRKTCRNALLRIKDDPAGVDAAIAAARIDGGSRGERLSLSDIVRLTHELRSRGLVGGGTP